MGILDAMLNLFNPAQGASIVSTAAHAAEKLESGAQLTDIEISALRDTAHALASQQAQYGYVDIDPELAETIADAAEHVAAQSPWAGYWDRYSGEWVQ